MTPFRLGILVAALAAVLMPASRLVAEDAIVMPAGAFMCQSVEPVIEHSGIVASTEMAGLREFVEGNVNSGQCSVIQAEAPLTVVDVDQRGYALVEVSGYSGQWWTHAENVWGYFDTPAKVKAWKKS